MARDTAVFGWNNLADPDLNPAISLAGGGTIASLPVQNLQDEQPQKYYRTIGTTAYFIADFGAAQSIACAAIAFTNLSIGATARLRASLLDATCLGSLVYDSTTDASLIYAGPDPRFNGNVLFLPSAAFNARYLRIDVDDPAPVVPAGAPNYVDLGLAFAGPLFAPGNNFSFGDAFGYADLSDKKTTTGGQVMSRKNPKARERRFSLDALTEDEVFDQVLEMDRLIGITKGFLIVPNPASARLAAEWWWGTVVDVAGVSRPEFATFSKTYQFRERL